MNDFNSTMNSGSLAAEDMALLKKLFGCTDNTSLGGADTAGTIERLCARSLDMRPGCGSLAAVCVYPVFVRQAKLLLNGSGIKVATVTGGFPSGQTPLEVKLQETEYALREGADEIDFVIARRNVLEGRYDAVRDEVAAVKKLCGQHTLKVILETGELLTASNIMAASTLAIEGGADIIKTSTGKSAVSATPEAVDTMLMAIKKYHQATGLTVGLKVAGGLKTIEQVLNYAHLAAAVMGDEYIDNKTFRIGTSRLVEEMFTVLSTS